MDRTWGREDPRLGPVLSPGCCHMHKHLPATWGQPRSGTERGEKGSLGATGSAVTMLMAGAGPTAGGGGDVSTVALGTQQSCSKSAQSREPLTTRHGQRPPRRKVQQGKRRPLRRGWDGAHRHPNARIPPTTRPAFQCAATRSVLGASGPSVERHPLARHCPLAIESRFRPWKCIGDLTAV